MQNSANVLSSETITYTVDSNITIVGEAWGSPENRTIIFAHGGGQTRHAWKNTAKILAEHGWYSIAIDLRGHGDSSWSPRGDYQIEAFVKDLRYIATTFNKPPILVGASLGGITGLLAEGESDHRVFSSVILVDIAHRHEKRGVDRILSFMGDKMKEGFANLEEAQDAISKYLPHRSRPTDLSHLKKNLRLGTDDRYYWHWDPEFLKIAYSIKNLNNFDRLINAAKSIKIPTLIVRGRMSDVISKETVMEFLDLVPHAKFIDVKGAGHMIAGDRNDIFSDSVINFLKNASF